MIRSGFHARGEIAGELSAGRSALFRGSGRPGRCRRRKQLNRTGQVVGHRGEGEREPGFGELADDRKVHLGAQPLLHHVARGLEPHDDPDIQGGAAERLEKNPRLVCGRILSLEVVGDAVQQLHRLLHLVGGGAVNEPEHERIADHAAVADVFDRNLGDPAVRNAEQTLVRSQNPCAAHADRLHDAVDFTDLDPVADPERPVENDDQRTEKVRQRLARSERHRQSGHPRAGQQRRDVQLKDALADEEHGHHCKRDLQQLPGDVDHQCVEIVVRPLCEGAHFEVEERDELKSGPGRQQRQPGEEKPRIERIEFRQRMQHRQQEQENHARNHHKNQRPRKRSDKLPAHFALLRVVVRDQPPDAEGQPGADQDRNPRRDEESQKRVLLPVEPPAHLRKPLVHILGDLLLVQDRQRLLAGENPVDIRHRLILFLRGLRLADLGFSGLRARIAEQLGGFDTRRKKNGKTKQKCRNSSP